MAEDGKLMIAPPSRSPGKRWTGPASNASPVPDADHLSGCRASWDGPRYSANFMTKSIVYGT
ncbi:hypothetical protein HK413_03210 [Mucilaginibacter sp. S1162]|uniref:Uncharacterized protein n=1 Tax=Mucilaginibacter humi TaxID=2732510 RepID=A0ABX1W2G6_9SPHI|nr:hypothetical protein [Mucilaginibacter humi]NNU33409.1 hypothetical protein [Mucilaginibacter humi]